MITNRQKLFISYFAAKSLFLGIGYSLSFDACGNDTWLSFILGSLLGLMFCYMLKKIMDHKKHRNLTDLLKEMSFTGIIVRIILILFTLVIINEILFIIQIFAKSFFLIDSNTFLIILPIVLLATYVGFKGYKLLSYVSECIFPIAIFFTVVGCLAALSKIDLENLKPILSHTNFEMIKGIFYYFSLSAIPNLLMLDLDLEDNDLTKPYLFTTFVVTLLAVFIVGILGPFLITIYRFPEYMVLKNIEILNFIEKVENIISISWILDNFILLCLATCFLKRLLPEKYNNYTYLTLITTIFLIICLVFGNNYIKDLKIYLYLPHMLCILAIPTVLILFIHSIKTKKV